MTDQQRTILGREAVTTAYFVLALIVVRTLGAFILPMFDDAFITLRYSRNLVEGNGFLYNPGEWVLGTTAPGFGLLNALFYAVGLPMPQSVIVLGIACDATVLAIVMMLLAKKRSIVLAQFFGVLFIASPIFTRIAVGGMEVNLFLLLGLTSILLYHHGKKYPAVIIAAFCYFLRPESVMLVAILCLTELFTGSWRTAVAMGAVALACVLPGLGIIYTTYGTIIPQSVAAKSLLPPQPYIRIFRQLLTPDPLAMVVLPFAIYGYVLAMREGGYLRSVAFWGSAYIVAYGISRPMVWLWYGVATYFMILLFGAIGMMALAQRVRLVERPLFTRLVTPLALALPVVIWIGVVAVQRQDDSTVRVYRPLAKWCSDNGISPANTIAAYDIGAVGYYSNAHIYDLAGLVWPEAARRKFAYKDIVVSHRPDYLYLYATRETAGWTSEPEIRDLYEPIARFSKFGHTDIEVSREKFEEKWVQDYILFRRRDL